MAQPGHGEGRRRRDVEGDREPGRRRPRARPAGDGFDGGAQDAADADPAQTAPVSACGRVRWDRAAAMTAVAGIGQGAATPAPQPTSSPAGTDRGTLMPQGWPGRSSRIATALPTTAAPANASDVASSARSGSALIRCSCLPVLRAPANRHKVFAASGHRRRLSEKRDMHIWLICAPSRLATIRLRSA